MIVLKEMERVVADAATLGHRKKFVWTRRGSRGRRHCDSEPRPRVDRQRHRTASSIVTVQCQRSFSGHVHKPCNLCGCVVGSAQEFFLCE